MTVSEVGVGPDPDPTPTMTPWQEYLAAAQSLDAVVREAAATPQPPPRPAPPDLAQAELSRLRERLDQQRTWLIGDAVRSGLPAPWLVPTPAEQAAAQARVAADPAAVAEVLRHGHRLLDLADAQLTPPPVSPAPPATPVSAAPPAVSAAPVSAAPGSAPTRDWWPPPVWLMVAVPLGAATLVVCALTVLLALLR